MDYYEEMRVRLEKYRKVHAGNPRAAVAKMLLWNVYFMFKGNKKQKSSQSSRYVAGFDEKAIKKMEQDVRSTLLTNQYKETDNMLEFQRELMQNNRSVIESKVRGQLQNKAGELQRVDVVFITDDNYAMPTATAISSLYYNASPTTDYHVYVLGVELSVYLADVIRMSGKNVQVIALGNMFSQFDFSHEHVTKAALYKFNICDILPDIKKVLYLDSDMLFQKDLSEFFQTDLDDRYAAVVKDLHVMRQKYKGIAKMGLRNYFNSGVMLLNLEKIRKERIPEKLLATKQDLNLDNTFSFMDQDTFNKVFDENVIFASVNYNFLNVYYREIEKLDMAAMCNLPIDEVYEIYDVPAVLHIGGKDRPWKTILGEKSLLYNKYVIINKIFREVAAEERG